MQKPAIKINKKTKEELDRLIFKKGETYDDIINGLLKWKWYKERNKYLEEVFHRQDEEIDEYQKEIAELQKKIPKPQSLKKSQHTNKSSRKGGNKKR